MRCPNCKTEFSLKAGMKAFSEKYSPRDQYLKCPKCLCVGTINDFLPKENV